MEELPLILVIEDDYPVQGVVEEMLADGGFATDILSSGEEALTLFKGRLKNYKALVTDVSLKGRLNGWEVASRIREIDAGFPIVYMSGASADDWPSKGVPNSIMLAKPFAPAQLVTAVSNLLNTGSPPTAPYIASNVKGVEVYPTGRPRPQRFEGDPHCGAIVVWTK